MVTGSDEVGALLELVESASPVNREQGIALEEMDVRFSSRQNLPFKSTRIGGTSRRLFAKCPLGLLAATLCGIRAENSVCSDSAIADY